MSGDEYLGEFEHLVMLAVLRLGDEAYGVPIRQTIEERGQRPVSFGAVYSTLRRLRKKGYVATRHGDPEPVRGGRAKKFFVLEPRGLEVLQSAQLRMTRMASGLDSELGVPGGEGS